nr:hypothetical protein Iba_scaffold11578CG0020 [Ipomoea batatas]
MIEKGKESANYNFVSSLSSSSSSSFFSTSSLLICSLEALVLPMGKDILQKERNQRLSFARPSLGAKGVKGEEIYRVRLG